MTISIIAAVAKNGVIGKDGKLPWKLSDDLKNFKKLTKGHVVIMGRKTYESIGKPLPDRINIVLSRNTDYKDEGIIVCTTFQEAIDNAKKLQDDEIFVIGGEAVFNKALKKADKLYLTHVNANLDGDTFFPSWNQDEWRLINKKDYKKDKENEYDFTIRTYIR